MSEAIGRELPEFPEHATYNFGCACGWWGIARIPFMHEQATCPHCKVAYRQWKDEDGKWRLSPIVQ